MKQLIKFPAFFLIAMFVFASCKKEQPVTTPPITNNNKPPVAHAGIDQTIVLPKDSVTLNGSASTDPDGTIISYKWTKISGPVSYVITSPDSSKTTVTSLIFGVYQFELTVTDNSGLSAKSTVSIIVNGNQQPVARAGADILNELSCGNKVGYTQLDGSGSYDPDGNIVSYSWAGIYGTPGYLISDASLAKTWVHNFSPGEYAFELTVKDAGGLSSKDTVLVHVTGTPGPAKEYNLDMTINLPYGFYNDYNDPYNDPPGFYYDYTGMDGKSIFLPLGEFYISVNEYADSVESSNVVYGSYIEIFLFKPNSTQSNGYLIGDLVGVNFRNLIRAGGGSFTGTFTVRGGSADSCDPNVFKGLPPLIVTGSLNTTTHMVNLRITGRAFF